VFRGPSKGLCVSFAPLHLSLRRKDSSRSPPKPPITKRWRRGAAGGPGRTASPFRSAPSGPGLGNAVVPASSPREGAGCCLSCTSEAFIFNIFFCWVISREPRGVGEPLAEAELRWAFMAPIAYTFCHETKCPAGGNWRELANAQVRTENLPPIFVLLKQAKRGGDEMLISDGNGLLSSDPCFMIQST